MVSSTCGMPAPSSPGPAADEHDPFTFAAAWDGHRFGEWGLRFWLVLRLQRRQPRHRLPPSTRPRRAVTAAVGHRIVALVAERPPLLATAHADLAMRSPPSTSAKGYFFLGSARRARQASPALRCNLDEMPTTASPRRSPTTPGLARAKARDALGTAPAARLRFRARPAHGRGARRGARRGRLEHGLGSDQPPPLHRHQPQLDRQKFGGFGVWLDDILLHALMAGLLDVAVARENLAAVFAGQTPQGNLPCLVTARDAWVDRSQPPIGAFVLWLLLRGAARRACCAAAYPALARNHDWWWRERDRQRRRARRLRHLGGGRAASTAAPSSAAKDEI